MKSEWKDLIKGEKKMTEKNKKEVEAKETMKEQEDGEAMYANEEYYANWTDNADEEVIPFSTLHKVKPQIIDISNLMISDN